MRGPRMRGRSDGASVSEIVLGLDDDDRGEGEVASGLTVDSGTAADRSASDAGVRDLVV